MPHKKRPPIAQVQTAFHSDEPPLRGCVCAGQDMIAAMKDKPDAPRCFHMHETARRHALEGLPLAAFWQRALGFSVDLIFALLVWVPLEFSIRRYLLHQSNVDLKWDFHEPGNILVMVLYWAVFNRPPTDAEVKAGEEFLKNSAGQEGFGDMLWAMFASPGFAYVQ